MLAELKLLYEILVTGGWGVAAVFLWLFYRERKTNEAFGGKVFEIFERSQRALPRAHHDKEE